jgi:hypothetical protein
MTGGGFQCVWSTIIHLGYVIFSGSLESENVIIQKLQMKQFHSKGRNTAVQFSYKLAFPLQLTVNVTQVPTNAVTKARSHTQSDRLAVIFFN